MNKKLLLVISTLVILLILGGCPIPLDIAICGNNICESGENNICPSDCGGTTIADVSCDNTCHSPEMCVGSFENGDKTCCVGSCASEITEIRLSEGWNFVSFPFVELNDPIEDFFADTYSDGTAFFDAVDSIYSYQDGWRVWHNDKGIPGDLENIEAGRAYVIIMNNEFTIQLDNLRTSLDILIADKGTSRSPHEITVFKGWNFVASTYGEDEDVKEKPLINYFDTIEDSYESVWRISIDGDLDKLSISDNENLIPTYAYWLYMDSDGEIIP